VVQTVRKQAAAEAADKAAARALEALNKGAAVEEAVSGIPGVEVRTTEPLGRGATLVSPEFVRTALSLREDKPAARVEADGAVYLLRLVRRIEPDPAGLETAQESLRTRLLQEKKANLLASWLAAARKAAQVEVNEDLLERMR